MRILFCLSACLLFCVNLPAQLPQLTAADPASPIYLSTLSIDVRVIGNRATTTFTMAFHNPSKRVLEGQFAFPLPEGAYVTRYALDVAGKMREGVPVEKVRATQVFEAIEKRQVDPGLLEKTEGANFRTRIYPVPAGGERRVIVGFEQELPVIKSGELVYQLPLEAKEVLRTLSINVTVLQQGPSPLLDAIPFGSLAFIPSSEGYTARAQGENVRLKGALAFRIPKNSSRPEVFVQKGDGRHTFYVHTALSGPAKEKVLPKSVAVIWDNSLSGLYRDTASELQLLKNYLTECRNTTVLLYSLHNRFRAEGEYAIREGNTKALLQKIRSLPYDGGTDYGRIRLPKVEEVLFFSDGVSTLSDSPFPAAPCPVYAISGSSRANHGTLRSIAQSNGGVFINLKNTAPDEAMVSQRSQSFFFLGVK
ncbi:MAG: TonB-dependent receptor, partial [Sphingobacteriales bacterium]